MAGLKANPDDLKAALVGAKDRKEGVEVDDKYPRQVIEEPVGYLNVLVHAIFIPLHVYIRGQRFWYWALFYFLLFRDLRRNHIQNTVDKAVQVYLDNFVQEEVGENLVQKTRLSASVTGIVVVNSDT